MKDKRLGGPHCQVCRKRDEERHVEFMKELKKRIAEMLEERDKEKDAK